MLPGLSKLSRVRAIEGLPRFLAHVQDHRQGHEATRGPVLSSAVVSLSLEKWS